MENPAHLPTNHKFTLYRDEKGNYILESQQEKGLVLDGISPNDVVVRMVETIPDWESFKVWARLDKEPISVESVMPTFENFQEMCSDPKPREAYTDHAEKALTLYREFEKASLEVLSLDVLEGAGE